MSGSTCVYADRSKHFPVFVVYAAKKGGVGATTDPFLLNVNAMVFCVGIPRTRYIWFINRVSFEDQIWLIELKRSKWVLVAIMAKLIQLTNDKLAYTV